MHGAESEKGRGKKRRSAAPTGRLHLRRSSRLGPFGGPVNKPSSGSICGRVGARCHEATLKRSFAGYAKNTVVHTSDSTIHANHPARLPRPAFSLESLGCRRLRAARSPRVADARFEDANPAERMHQHPGSMLPFISSTRFRPNPAPPASSPPSPSLLSRHIVQ